jgi:hypothetical protein
MSMLHCAANNCHVGALKRALMEKDALKQINKHWGGSYPIDCAALRFEPGVAVDVVRTLLKHGACPNALLADGVHLLEACQCRTMWIDDPMPNYYEQVVQGV